MRVNSPARLERVDYSATEILSCAVSRSTGIGSFACLSPSMQHRIASLAIDCAWSIFLPSVTRPGKDGTATVYPPCSSASKKAVYWWTRFLSFFMYGLYPHVEVRTGMSTSVWKKAGGALPRLLHGAQQPQV